MFLKASIRFRSLRAQLNLEISFHENSIRCDVMIYRNLKISKDFSLKFYEDKVLECCRLSAMKRLNLLQLILI